MPQSLNRFLSLVLLVLSVFVAHAQPQDNSPYSRYGLGNLQSTNFAPLSSMGGLYSTYNSVYHINTANPASYSSLTWASFEVGAFGRFANLQTSDDNLRSRAESGSLSYLALGFPVFNPLNRITQKKDYPFDWGMSFGLIPYSSIGYSIEREVIDPDFGQATYNNQGSGQLYKLYYGNGLKINGLSVGFNVAYLFGKIEDQKTIVFDELTYALADQLTDQNNTKGFLFDLGLQYEKRIGAPPAEDEDDYRPTLTLGATFTPGIGATTIARKSYVRQNFVSGSLFSDTIVGIDGEKDKMNMPSIFSFGISYKAISDKKMQWMLGLNYEGASWNNFSSPNHLDDLAFASKMGIGMEIIPEVRSYNSYVKRIAYRLGAFYNKDPRVIGTTQLTNYGITFGFGLPIRVPGNKTSHINLAFELGKLGTKDIIEENYLRATVGFTLNDKSWFYKRKYK